MSRPLDALFSPRSVAVIGASRRRDSIGFSLLHNLLASEFQGAVYPVNPNTEFVHSLKCYPSVGAIADPVDLAVIAVPRAQVLETAEACLAKGVRALVVITAGFAETGPEGAALENRLCDLVRAAGVRMIGPNCMGIINTDSAVRLDATFAPVPAQAGSLGFVSQSGALGVAILNVAKDLGIGLTQFVSMGNKADVSGNDLLEHWEDDPATRVICMYLESFGNPRRFTEIAKRVGRKKPILIVKSGRSAAGARAATSHTGAISGADVTASAFLEQCGVLRANTIEELFDVARALDRCQLPGGKRVGIVTNAGGPAIMATDACVDQSLDIAELADATRAELASFLPAGASLRNPVDMIASADGDSYRRTLAAVLADPGVDMAIVINVTPLLSNPIDILEAIGAACAGQTKPVLAVVMATEEFYEAARQQPALPPVFRFPESAARALAMLHRYADWRRRPAAETTAEFAVDDTAVAALLEKVENGYLEPADALRVLELYGIPTARWRMARTREEALAAGRELGYPLAMKAIAADLVHKTEAGAVRLDLEDEAALGEALTEMTQRVAGLGLRLSGYLVQEMARGGHETIFGVATDPQFGPLVMFGLGGIYVEVLHDVRFGVLPLTAADAAAMVRGIRGFALLAGVRGEPPADLEFLEQVLLRLAQLVTRHPAIRELDINPFLAAPVGARARALDARIRVENSPMAR
jgi:acetate---CoA ligase (ADP-forming)